MEEDLDLMRIHAEHGQPLVDESFALHVHGDLDCGGRGPFPRPGLQKIECPVLDGKLDILHVSVVFFQPPANAG